MTRELSAIDVYEHVARYCGFSAALALEPLIERADQEQRRAATKQWALEEIRAALITERKSREPKTTDTPAHS